LKGIIEDPGEDFNEINVLTISLNDLFDLHKVPEVIDYISLDIEGNEYNTLKTLDFSKRHINCFTVEHEFSENRAKIYHLLTQNGFERVQDTHCDNEDWYVNKVLR
jgi:hypothetical protein